MNIQGIPVCHHPLSTVGSDALWVDKTMRNFCGHSEYPVVPRATSGGFAAI